MTGLLTAQELMQALKISRSTLVRLKRQGLPTVGNGKLTRYDPAKALEWFHQYSHQNTSKKEMLSPGLYQCSSCGFQGHVKQPTTPGPCPQCTSMEVPIKVA